MRTCLQSQFHCLVGFLKSTDCTLRIAALLQIVHTVSKVWPTIPGNPSQRAYHRLLSSPEVRVSLGRLPSSTRMGRRPLVFSCTSTHTAKSSPCVMRRPQYRKDVSSIFRPRNDQACLQLPSCLLVHHDKKANHPHACKAKLRVSSPH